jgi:hypothetical protein
MHKTFTDCYFAPGFIGGGWAYALNSNDAGGEVISAAKDDVPTVLGEHERRLAYYCIGWETVEVSGWGCHGEGTLVKSTNRFVGSCIMHLRGQHCFARRLIS